MIKSHTIEHVNGITKVHFSKTPSYSEIKTIIDDIADHFPYEKRLWDFTNTLFSFNANNMKSIAKYGKTKYIKPNRLAVITSDDMAFEEMLLFQKHRKQNGHLVAKIFKTVREAIAWLQD